MRTEWNSVSLDSLGVLRARGAEVVSFLQGQLSNDVALLGTERSLLAGYHNPQGRVIALLRVLQLAPDDVLAILPRELIGVVVQRLGKFVLRAKVKLADDSGAWTVSGLMRCAPPAGAAASAPASNAVDALPATVNGVTRIDASLALRVAEEPARWLLVSPLAQPPPVSGCGPVGVEVWQRLAIAAGEPQVYAATSEAFVAQMLNLDALGAIAFDKGCYTGQEIIARAHYRGKVKRRLQRFRARLPAQLKPGDDGELGDGRSFKVVDAAQRTDGLCEFLAVTTLGHVGAEPAGGRAPAEAAPLSAEWLALPYVLPD
jgi:folate-binding protein YgfZ